MAKNIFSLDIGDDLVTGVLLSSAQKVNVIAGCGVATLENKTLQEAVCEVIEQTGYTQGPCNVSFAAGNFFFHNLNLPFSGRKKIATVLPYELEEIAPLPMDKLVFDFIVAGEMEGRTEVVVAMCEKSFLADKLDLLESIGIDPDMVGIGVTHTAVNMAGLNHVPTDFILLNVGLARATYIFMSAGKIVLVRSLVFDTGLGAGFRYDSRTQSVSVLRPANAEGAFEEFAVFVRQTLLAMPGHGLQEKAYPVFLSGPMRDSNELARSLQESINLEHQTYNLLQQPLLKIDPKIKTRWDYGIMDHGLALAIMSRTGAALFNFRKDDFKKKSNALLSAKVMAFAATVLLGLVVAGGSFLWFDFSSMKQEKERLTIRTHEIFRQTLPDVGRIVDPLQQMRVHIKEASKASLQGKNKGAEVSALDLLAEVSERVPGSVKVRISRMVIDKNGLLLKGTTDTFNSVDLVQKRLEASPYFMHVKINSANMVPKSSDVRFELKIQLKES